MIRGCGEFGNAKDIGSREANRQMGSRRRIQLDNLRTLLGEFFAALPLGRCNTKLEPTWHRKQKLKSFVRVRPAGTLLWLNFGRVEPHRWFSGGSIVESMHWMVLHRPVELARVMGQLKISARQRRTQLGSSALALSAFVGTTGRQVIESFARRPSAHFAQGSYAAD
jgi:hypothetical protein